MTKTVRKNSKRAHIGIAILAILFWFMVKMNQEYDYALDIPLKVLIHNDEICLKYPAPDSVMVAFLGRGIDLLQLNLYEPAYEVDLSAEQGQFVMTLSEHREYVHISDELSVRVKSIVRPHEITFEMDERRSKKVPVKALSEVKTDDGFIMVNAYAKPDSVVIAGPASFLDTLKFITTEKRSYKKVKLAFHDDLKIQKNVVYFGDYQPETVEVFFNVQRLAEKEVKNVPVKMENVPDAYDAVPLPSVVTIYVKGGEKILGEADVGDFKVIIDFEKEWEPGKSHVKAAVETDLNISYIEIRPAQFELLIQKVKKS